MHDWLSLGMAVGFVVLMPSCVSNCWRYKSTLKALLRTQYSIFVVDIEKVGYNLLDQSRGEFPNLCMILEVDV